MPGIFSSQEYVSLALPDHYFSFVWAGTVGSVIMTMSLIRNAGRQQNKVDAIWGGGGGDLRMGNHWDKNFD